MSSEPLLALEEGGKAGTVPWEDNCALITLQCRPSRRRQITEALLWCGTPVLLGLLLGLLLPTRGTLPLPYDRLSSVTGWIYFSMWSISFWPQFFQNHRRKSVVGLSLDFQLLNMLGFGCYAVYNAALYWSPTVRREYACMTGGMTPAVHANDVFFALHAAVATSFTLVQCAVYDRGGQRVSWPALIGTGGSLAAIAAYLAAVAGAATQSGGGGGGSMAAPGGLGGPAPPCGAVLSWLSFLYFLSYIKLGVSLVKYIPQVCLNYRRKSTAGWNIHNIVLDFSGGMLSLAQQIMDSVVLACWEAITGNPVKFALGFTSIFFDVIFMAQHWCLYPAGGLQSAREWAKEEEGEQDGSNGSDGARAAAAALLASSSQGIPPAGPAALPVPLARSSSGSGGSGGSSRIFGAAGHEAGSDPEAAGSSGSTAGGVWAAADHTPLPR